MLNRPLTAVMARIVEAVGALVAVLTKPFVSLDLGYAQVVPGPKSRKVRQFMLNRPFKSVIARTAIFALALSLAISFVSVGLTPAAFAQTADAPKCVPDDDDGVTECSYEENGTDVVTTFSSASDPEGAEVEWAVEGPDAADFDATGGVLTFKKSPNYEMPSDRDDDLDTDGDQNAGDNEYKVSVRVTELLAEGQDPPALSTVAKVTVKVTDVEEKGSLDLSRLQPQVGEDLEATLSDPDRGEGNSQDPSGQTWQWSVPKVKRPTINNEDHWQAAASPGNTAGTYSPAAGDVGKSLRVMVTYTDAQGADKKAYLESYHPVRAVPTSTNTAPNYDNTDIEFSISEDSTVGADVGTPVVATDADRDDIITYVLSGGGDEAHFKIDKKTGQLTVGVGVKLDHEQGGDEGEGVYEVEVIAYDPSNNTDGGAYTAKVNITATDVNEAPTVTGSTEGEIPEKSSTPAGDLYTPFEETYNKTDVDDGDETTFSLSGADKDLFDLSAAGVLTFKDDPDFENPKDDNKDNAYKVTVVATDKDGLTGTKDVTIKVINFSEGGKVMLSTIQPGVGVAITADLTDPDGGVTAAKWQWLSSDTADGTFKKIAGRTSSSYTPTDEGKFLRVTVRYRDKASPEDDPDSSESVTETSANAARAVPEVNEAPEFGSASITREVNENETGNVGDPVTADDADGDALTYSLSGGADMSSFKIVQGSGQIQVGDGTKLDAEGKTSYKVEVTAADPFGESATTTVTITVKNVNEAPDFKAEDPDDYEENGTGPVATLKAEDPEGAGVEWSLRGLDGEFFSIDADGVLTFKKSPDFEAPTDKNRDADIDETVVAEAAKDNDYLVTIQATEVRAADADGATMSTTQDITVTVKNVDEPGSIDLSRLQPQVGQYLEATLSDPDGVTANTETWQWSVPKVERPKLENNNHWSDAAVSGDTDATYSPVEENVGKSLRVMVTYTDAQGADKKAYLESYHPVRAVPTSTNTAPNYDNTDIKFSISEASPVGAAVGTPVVATDADRDDIITYVLSGGGDEAHFKIDKKTGQLTVGVKLDHEQGGEDGEGVYEVEVIAYDPSNNTGAANTAKVNITATDVNEAPTVTGSTEGEIPEKSSTPTGDGYTPFEETYNKTDVDDGDETTFSLSGDDKDLFDLSEGGVLTFKDDPDFENPKDDNKDNAYKVTVEATDKNGLTGAKDVTIEVINVNEGGKVMLSTIQPGVDQEITATVTDPDDGVTGAKWQWLSSDTAAGTFTDIDGAMSSSYTPTEEGKFLKVTVTYRDNASPKDDPDTADVEEGRGSPITATSANAARAVPAVNNAPEFGSASITREVNENETGNVGDPVTADDADKDALTYSLSGGADKAAFDINQATGQITVGAGTELNYEGSQKTYMVEVTATDPFGKSATTTVTITVKNVNEAPDLTLSTLETPMGVVGLNSVSYAENGMDAVGTYTAAGATSWSVSGDDSGDFTISSGGELAFSVPPDFEAPADADTDNVYMVTVTARDGADSAMFAVTVTVTDVDDTEIPGTFDPLLSYDADNDGSINKDEVFDAIDDYFARTITKEQVFEVIDLYFQ